MSETINLLKAEIAKVDKDIQHRQSKISELSMKVMDGCIRISQLVQSLTD